MFIVSIYTSTSMFIYIETMNIEILVIYTMYFKYIVSMRNNISNVHSDNTSI